MHPYIHKYRDAHTQTVLHGGSLNEQTIRQDFINLINAFAQERNLRLIPELRDPSNNTIPDGTLKDQYQCTYGTYEAKDPKDDLDQHIQIKLQNKGYTSDNILFENAKIAVLYQDGKEVQRIDITNDKALENIIRQFLDFKRQEIQDFQQAVQTFKNNIPDLLTSLRTLIHKAQHKVQFTHQRNAFLKQCQAQINPNITNQDIREMIIQHFLTSKLFNSVFTEVDFHRDHHLASKIDQLCRLALDKTIRYDFEMKNQHFYKTLEIKARAITNHHDKQGFLKTLYEEFYKAYNPKAADRLGVVYTPNEIIRFMIQTSDLLLLRHFKTSLSQKNVNILDPATGTGTFITELIDFLPKAHLKSKYKDEIFASEVAILPYYIASLNIEYTYRQKMKNYEPFENIAFVDTLDNEAALDQVKQQKKMRFGITEENVRRIEEQNKAKISVIIGNPPYNANQQNYNDQNANRKYEAIDQKIKTTFAKASTAQKLKLEDMYVRFYRWAIDRLDPKKGGIVAFITNNSFLTARGFDGFRQWIYQDFDYLYIIDLGGNIRANYGKKLKLGNVFGIQVGVCISFLIKTSVKNERQKLFYHALEDQQSKESKLNILKGLRFEEIDFEEIMPDANHNWLDLTDNDFEDLLPLCSKQTKLSKVKFKEQALFKLYSLGINTARDAWVYDFDTANLKRKVDFFCKYFEKIKSDYDSLSDKKDFKDTTLKYTSELVAHLDKKSRLEFNPSRIRLGLFRPFIKKYTYFDKIITHRIYQQDNIFSIIDKERDNKVIQFSGLSHSKSFHCLATNLLPCLDNIEKGQCLPRYRYNQDGHKIDNITDWGLKQFRKHYPSLEISKDDIFDYVYAVLHCPKYRQTYEQNLKRDLPRIPFYEDFEKWAAAGKKLLNLHLNYESVDPYPLRRLEVKVDYVKVKLKADKAAGEIMIDSQTRLGGIPAAAWAYELGNRSALEWVLDQYKEKGIRDKTVREKFNAYHFSDYKEGVIVLLQKVARVSVETAGIICKF